MSASSRLAWFVAAIWAAVAAWRLRDPWVPAHDEPVYVILGDALASGHGYRDLQRPGEPSHRVYPPGYPLALGLLRAAGIPLMHLRWLAVACGAAFLWLVVRRFGDRLPPGLAAPAALLGGLGGLHEGAVQIMADAPAALLCLAGLLWTERWGAVPRALCREGAAAMACLLAAALTRHAALAAVAAGASWLALDAPVCGGRLRKAALLLAVAGGGWAAWSLRGDGAPPGLSESFLIRDPFGSREAAGASMLLARLRDAILVNLPVFTTRLAWIGAPDHPPPWPCHGVFLLAAAGLGWRLLRHRTAMEHFGAATLLMLALTHNIYDRHLAPVAPFLLGWLGWGLLLPLRGRGHLTSIATVVAAALLWTAATWGTGWRLAHPRGIPEHARGIAAAGPWLRQHAAPGDLAFSADAPCLYLHAGLKGFDPGRDPARLAEAIRSGTVRWIVATEGEAWTKAFAAPVLRKEAAGLTLRARWGPTALYEAAGGR